jgi:hypothetical protein
VQAPAPRGRARPLRPLTLFGGEVGAPLSGRPLGVIVRELRGPLQRLRRTLERDRQASRDLRPARREVLDPVGRRDNHTGLPAPAPSRTAAATGRLLRATGPAVDPDARRCVALPRCARVGVPPLSGRDCWPQGQLQPTLLRSGGGVRTPVSSGTPRSTNSCPGRGCRAANAMDQHAPRVIIVLPLTMSRKIRVRANLA